MTNKHYHILFEDKGYDFTLKEAEIILDHSLGEYEFELRNISNLNFDVDTVFTLTNDMLNIRYLVKVKKTYDDRLILKILEWQE